ncbi:LytR C-terminal domain-containing protein [Janibacter sp. GXQ6167]|uniref:LytR C-terminal domain-containing protein n=1 Tax=Janibacter sp. GXQ6167 TaxID=3240791 RepID=UPI00352535B7
MSETTEDIPRPEHTPEERRRRRALVTFVIVMLFLAGAFWYAYSYYRDSTNSSAAPAPSVTRTCTLQPKSVQVNVYNATSRDGLAGRVSKELKQRGFTIKTVANDPKKTEVTGVGQIRYGTKGAKGAKLVGSHFAGAKTVTDQRKYATVDVVLGPKFRALEPEDRVTPTC